MITTEALRKAQAGLILPNKTMVWESEISKMFVSKLFKIFILVSLLSSPWPLGKKFRPSIFRAPHYWLELQPPQEWKISWETWMDPLQKKIKGKNGGSTVLYPPHMSSCSRESKNYGNLNKQNLSTQFHASDENLASPTPATNASGLGALCQRQDKEMKWHTSHAKLSFSTRTTCAEDPTVIVWSG